MNLTKMKAIVFEKYGPPEVLELKEIPRPIPKANEVLVRIRAVTVNAGDCELRSPKIPNLIWFVLRLYFGFFTPRKKILGAYFSGDVEEVGASVQSFKKGDPVFACSGPRFGAYAEYTCMDEDDAIAVKSNNMSYAEASALPLGLDAVHFLRLAKIKSGQSILINGAGGGIGTIAVQLAKHFGAVVTAVDSQHKLEMLHSLGADRVIDYTSEDFAEQGVQYDVIFDLVGKKSYARCLKSLKPNGCYLLANPSGLLQILRGVITTAFTRKKVISKFASGNKEDLIVLKELMDEGKITSVIDRFYPFEQVIEAHRFVESGKKKGNVVLSLD